MGFKYKIQEFQTKAAAAVTRVFDGQSLGKSQYVLDSGIDENQKQPVLGEMMMSFGWKNAEIRPEVRANLLEKINELQKENGIPESTRLESSAGCPINLTIEMETGVGKTYTYIKTIHE